MKTNKLFSNALISFNLGRRMLKASTLILLLLTVCLVGGTVLLVFGVDALIYGSSAYLTDATLSAFAALAGIHASIVILFSCTSASGEISGEKQRQTMDLLVCSQLTPLQITLGKLVSSFSYSAILSLSMLPVYSILYVFGGLSPMLILVTFGLMLLFALVMSSVSLWFSSVFKKPGTAAIMTLLFFVAITGGNGLIELFLQFISELIEFLTPGAYTYKDTYVNVPWVLTANPVVFLIACVGTCIEEIDVTYFSTTEWVELILSFTITPVFFIGLTTFSLFRTCARINPFKQAKRRA